MVFRNLFRLGNLMAKSKEIPELTNFLARNETFKKVAINSHQTTKGAWKNIEDWLDKELLAPEERKQIEE